MIGGQELVVAAAKTVELLRAWKSLTATASALQGAIVGAGRAAANLLGEAVCAIRPEPLPVSSTFCAPSDRRVKVNLGHTFSVESNVLEFIVIVPDEDLKMDRPTATSHVSVLPLP